MRASEPAGEILNEAKDLHVEFQLEGKLVELSGIEPLASSLRTRRSPS